jgi:hypothetical protein
MGAIFGDLVVSLLSTALFIVVILAAIFAYKLHKTGTPNKELLPQTQLKASDLFDDLRDRVLKIIVEESTKAYNNAALKDSYFDTDDFLMDLGRLPTTYTKAILLNGAIKRNGTGESVEYFVQTNGNVTRHRPT